MKRCHDLQSISVWAYAFATVLGAILVGVFVLNPIWSRFAPSGVFVPDLLPPIMAPVDGKYYIHNAEVGFGWTTYDPLSLWFHPLLSWILTLLPRWLPLNYWFWILGVLFAAASLPLVQRLAVLLSGKSDFPRWLLPLCLLAPGGLGMATGNAELPVLFFVLGLMLSVLVWHKWWLTVPFAVLAVLTKPNALYMVPILLIYFVGGLRRNDPQLYRQALLGIVALLGTWLAWSWLVDWKAGYAGLYWKLRFLSKYYTGQGDTRTFFEHLVASFSEHNVRNMVRYSTALLIPLANLLVIGLVPLKDETHRYAMAAGNLTMLVLTVYLGNPNKTIVYTSTLPGHFATHALLIATIIGTLGMLKRTQRIVVGVLYTSYCLATLFVFVLGTPMCWYY